MNPTIKDVAKAAGVGIGTASRVINQESGVSEKTRVKVLKAIEDLGFHTNASAKRLRTNKTRIIALMVPIIDHPFFAYLTKYVTKACDRNGYSVMLITSQQNQEKEKEIIQRMKRKEVDGGIFVTHYAISPEEIKDCNVVSLDRYFSDDVPLITTDNYDATYKAVEFLIEKGCQRIGYVGTKPLVESEVSLREAAYRDAIKKHNLEPYIVDNNVIHGDEMSVVEQFRNQFGEMDGMFASGYLMAKILYSAAINMGYKIPEDFQLVAYDGAFDFGVSTIQITSIEQPLEEIGNALVETLIKKINGEETEKKIVLKTKFIEGKTTK